MNKFILFVLAIIVVDARADSLLRDGIEEVDRIPELGPTIGNFATGILDFVADRFQTVAYYLRVDAHRSTKCIPGKRQYDTEDYITTPKFIRKNGYPAEEHTVVTEDGYIITLHRIPSSKPNAVPVFMQHGILCSSFDFVNAGKDRALGFVLAEKGYDVWLGNARGNTYSRCHTNYTTNDYEFWDYSFHEVAIYDMPAVITYITDIAKQKMVYIGHSMGTTVFFIMASERQDIADKVKAMISLSNVAYMSRIKSSLRYLAPIVRELEYFYPKIFGTYEFATQNRILKSSLKYLCTPTEIQRRICAASPSSVFGYSPYQTNVTLGPTVLTNIPAGMSFKILLHYLQEVNSAEFRQYDYGKEENLKRYNSTEPPNYDISKIKVPIGIYWSPNDYAVNTLDLQKFYKQLPDGPLFIHEIKAPLWNHLNFLWGIDVRRELNSKILSELACLYND